MATPSGQKRPWRYLALFGLIVAVLYSLVFFTGEEPTPKLGIDLTGGTRVTLTARTPDGSEPTQSALQQAQEIIQHRVNSTGVSGAEVVIEGNTIVITVPGQNGEKAKQLGQTAKLSFRKVIKAKPVVQTTQGKSGGKSSSNTQPSSAPQPSGTPSSGSESSGDPSGSTPSGGGAAAAAQQQDGSSTSDAGGATRPGSTGGDELATRIQQARQLRQDPKLIPDDKQDKQAVTKARTLRRKALASLNCSTPDVLRGNTLPDRPLVTCSKDGDTKFVLGPVFLPGELVEGASVVPPGRGHSGWAVSIQFESKGADIWAEFTSNNVGKRAALVLDGQVISAPEIQTAMLNGEALITGDFSRTEAEELAQILKYGALPLSFSQSDTKTVSATLGLASLRAGLIAGAVGIALVFIYCLFYYRMLGVMTVLSLILSAAVVYAVLVLLGRWIGFTLDLAGVAGFIIAIGVTADSFVIYFERLKDEIREGKSFRSAVSRGWIRARRTILASDAIMFLASAVLYILAVGEVKGFAFTLGMSTVLDLTVVFLVTHPLVAMIARSKKLSSPTLSGLGTVQRMGANRRSARRVGSVAAKEA